LFFFKLLKELELEFAYCSKITNNGVHALFACLNECKVLSVLNVNFSKCSGIRDDGKDCFEEIKNIEALSELIVDFCFFLKILKNIKAKICEIKKNMKIIQTTGWI